MAGELAERIGARIRERRLELGMKQRELADKLGSDAIDNQRISDWERGVNRPSDRYMEKLAAALDRDVSWFYAEQPDAETPDLMRVVNGDGTGDGSQLDRIEADLQAARTERHDLVAMLEQRIEQLERAVEHQTANLARQSKLLERIEERERRIFKVLEDAEVIERAADGAAAALAKGPPGGPELLGRSPQAQQPTRKRRRAKDAPRQDQRRDTA